MTKKAWENVFEMPVPGRSVKPRKTGFTMVIDKGLGVRAIADLMESAADYVDLLKLTFGTSAFFDRELLQKKIELVTRAGVDICPGGTFLEVAVFQDTCSRYLQTARELGFTTIEVSDGTVPMTDGERADIIRRARDANLKVISEVGKKDPSKAISLAKMHDQIRSDLSLGAFKVIVEARESGKGVGVFDSSGNVDEEGVDKIISGVEDPNDLVWEAPLKNQQQFFILKSGINVNLGNIAPGDILALEALRCGLRGDTLAKAVSETTGASP
jgi:phosphosulfolactate synthase